MNIIAGLWKRISYFISNQSMLKKLTFAYAIAILIPSVTIGAYNYFQSRTYMRNELAHNARQNLLQIKYNVDRKMFVAEGMVGNIANDSKIQNLLYYEMDFTPEALINFRKNIAGPINYALNFNDASIYHLCVYYSNETIPEYGSFFREERISNVQWFKDFKSSDLKSMWIYPAKSDRFKYNGVSGNTTVFKLVKKIETIDGKYLGAVALDILEEEMFSPINFDNDGQDVYVINDKNHIIYPEEYKNTAKQLELFNRNIKGNPRGHFFDGDIIYSYETIEPLNIKIVSKTNAADMISNSSSQSRWMITVVILGVSILEIFTYFMLKIIFSRLKQIVKIMNAVAKGNFSIRIPGNYNDEVGQLATDFNILIEKINQLISDSIRKETAQKDAQIAALQYQINPHFIYNTIDTFRMKMELKGDYEMADAITYFGKMLRYNISSNSKYATVREEVEYVEKYITLQKIRWGERIEYSVDVPEEVKSARIIRFMLQPIVENSIKHGISGALQILRIHIKLEVRNNRLEIDVIDSGKGIPPEQLDRLNYQLKYSNISDGRNIENGRSIGLENINNRLKLFYGEQYYIRMDSEPDEYTRIHISIPYDSNPG
ncbi:sensor histidine kinase [Pseudoclostridium thermosuccinogenes]|uniref:cache domain-containing sensor histidine kinase n=1 Tax=Clostridium thermosuccinogenes TaxID=84032 RepID=UPI002FDA90E9